MLIGDTGSGLFDELQENAPDQIVNAGIAEANMVTVAAGLAKAGYIPFVYAIGSHLVYRAYEQIRNDLCLNHSNVKILSVGSGLHYADHGPTHHNTEDFAVLKVLPRMTILSPSGGYDTKALTRLAAQAEGPIYIRLGRGKDTTNDYNLVIGKSVILREGKDVTIITTGSGVHETYSLLDDVGKNGIDIELLNIHTIKPIDESAIIKSAKKTKRIIVYEEHQKCGGLGELVADLIGKNQIKVKLTKMGIDDKFCSYVGTYDGIKKYYGLSKMHLREAILNMLN